MPMGLSDDMRFGYRAEGDGIRLELEELEREFQSGDLQIVKHRTARQEKRLENLKDRLQVR
jgi:hypothetical protein